mmetsp:Transcript_14723/g.28325  ORF Transcript_14723/g.28325 Transcript_14723/m.28325 type:complete len:85 (+) Transcript_14723:179-433(+)
MTGTHKKHQTFRSENRKQYIATVLNYPVASPLSIPGRARCGAACNNEAMFVTRGGRYPAEGIPSKPPKLRLTTRGADGTPRLAI